MLLSSLVRMAGRLLRVRGRGISAAWAMVLATAITTIPGIGVVGVMGVGTAHAQDCDPVEAAKLLADDGVTEDIFGTSVSISGGIAVIGRPGSFDNSSTRGAAYVFTSNGGVWTQDAKLLADDGAYLDRFGYAVCISGETIVLGAHGNSDYGQSSGSAYVFVRSGGEWVQQAKLLPDDGAYQDRFGISVSVNGDTVVIGAYLDDDNGTDSGSAYVFTRIGGAWTQQAKLLPNDGEAWLKFGEVVSINDDTIVVGEEHDNENGYRSGSAYVFTRIGSTWTQQAKLLPDDGSVGNRFGESVSIVGDSVLVGASKSDGSGYQTGAVYEFTRSGNEWFQQTKIVPIDGEQQDRFGSSVSLSGEKAVIGALFGDDDNGSDSGSVYVFTRTEEGWTEKAKLLASDGESADLFGAAVSLDNDMIAVGARWDDDNGLNAGSAYVFDLGCDAFCPADLNGDGIVNTQDFIVFLGAWSAGDPLADWDENGVIDTRDFIAFLGDWAAGCP